MSGPNAAERYLPGSDLWMGAGITADTLPNVNALEIGLAVLMNSGQVFAIGATSHAGVYTHLTDSGTWASGPDSE